MQLRDQQTNIMRIENSVKQLEEVKEKLYSESIMNYKNH